MSQTKLTAEKIERRLKDNLRKDDPHAVSPKFEEAPQTSMVSRNLLADAPENMTFSQRLRYRLVVKVLHKVNLTSYRRLRRAYAVVDDLQITLTRLLQERDEIAQRLRTVAADRDRLAAQIEKARPEQEGESQTVLALSIERERLAGQVELAEYKSEQLRVQLEALRSAHTRLQQDHQTLRAAYDQVTHRDTALETVIPRGNDPAGEIVEETVTLPLTVQVEAVVPHVEDVDAYLGAVGKIEPENEIDTFYYALEASLRGSEAEIKHRQQEYLPYLTPINPALPIVDLGCGRGEFLELMREQGIRALGVDTNAVNIEALRSKNLEVYHQDALAYLANAAPESLSAVTAFQVIEHIPNAALRSLIRLAHEKLAPGGFLLLETVNPYCLETFRTYYLDPTHQNPVPIDLLSLLYQFYGFKDKQLFLQSPIRKEKSAAETQELKFLYQAYALLGKKSADPQDKAR